MSPTHPPASFVAIIAVGPKEFARAKLASTVQVPPLTETRPRVAALMAYAGRRAPWSTNAPRRYVQRGDD